MSSATPKRLLGHPGLVPIEKALIREGRLQLLAASALSVSGCILAFVFMNHHKLFTAISWFCCLLGIYFIYRILLVNKTEQHPLVQLLTHRPKQVVWVYSVVTQRLPFGFQFSQTGILYFKLLDGDEISVELPVQQLKLVSKTLNRLLPHATFGYSDDKAQWYRANPELLIRNKEE